jgi:phenylacetate-CoA ligase
MYPHVPVPLQNAAISAFGIVYRHERFGGEFASVVAEFEARDRWPEDRMRQHVDTALGEVLRRAFDAPFYREHWAKAGITPTDVREITTASLHRLPVLKKDMVRRMPRAFVPDRGNKPGTLLTYYSSGSTGTPIQAICTRGGQRRFAAAREARSYRWAGTSILRPRGMIGGQPIVSPGSVRPPFHRYNATEKQVYFSAYHLTADRIHDYVHGLNRYRPECMTGYAFSQFRFAQLMVEAGLKSDAPLRAAVTSSEKLTDRMRAVIRDAWNCRAYEEYGSVENVALATECEAGSLHAHPDFGVLEIVDDQGHPVPPGVEGRLVCTGLQNDAQLLIRYEIGDTAAWSDQPCACGRTHLPRLAGITGRVEDVVVGMDGQQLVRFHSVFIDLPFVSEGQIVQEALDSFTIRVVADPEFGEAQVRVIEQRVRDRVGPVRVTVQRVQELERTERGKVRAVISSLRGQQNRR